MHLDFVRWLTLPLSCSFFWVFDIFPHGQTRGIHASRQSTPKVSSGCRHHWSSLPNTTRRAMKQKRMPNNLRVRPPPPRLYLQQWDGARFFCRCAASFRTHNSQPRKSHEPCCNGAQPSQNWWPSAVDLAAIPIQRRVFWRCCRNEW